MIVDITDKRYIDHTHIEIKISQLELSQLVAGETLYCYSKPVNEPDVTIRVVQ